VDTDSEAVNGYPYPAITHKLGWSASQTK